MLICSYPQSTRVRQHERDPHWVRGHFRTIRGNRVWIPEHIRSGSIVSEHCRA